ncbi:MAG: 30S ribosomal protein S12 methylthiotransferase RimO [Christensenellales bacterium]
MKVGTVSLGCDKNRIDTENMLAYLKDYGYDFTPDPSEAEIIIVNTCGFIESAKVEAINTVLEMAEYKKQGKCKVLVVTGCLVQRYMDEMSAEMPEIDVFLGTANYHKLPEILNSLTTDSGQVKLKNDINDRRFSANRVLTTPEHYAYVKIAEGCDNHCTYCAIPYIRGKYTSRTIQDIVQEVEGLLAKHPVKEIILVAQDVTNYGKDLYGEPRLIDLLEELSQLDVEWIRLMYLYPELITDKLLDYIASNPKICKYLDIPCQHISDTILKRMNRRVDGDYIRKLIDRIRSRGNFAIRSTFIVGFPGESQEDFDELYDFVTEAKLDRCGFFAYSCEEGTPAARLGGQIDEEVKQERVEALYALSEDILAQKLQDRVGEVVDVIYEGVDYDRQAFYGRTQFDAPDIDTTVYFTASRPVDIGTIYKVKIVGVDGEDSIGELI